VTIQEMCTGEASVVPAALTGYRMWNWDGYVLQSTGNPMVWESEVHQAECLMFTRPPMGCGFPGCPLCSGLNDSDWTHLAPAEGCTCGIYGWYRPDEARLHHGDIFGAVQATGRVLLGDFGFRAQTARIVALVGDSNLAVRWERYGVKVFTDRESLIAEFPPDDVRELIGHDIPDTPYDVGVWFPVSNFRFTTNVQAFKTAMLQAQISAAGAAKAMSAAFAGTATAYGSWNLPTCDEPTDETPRDRALRLRRNRPTGPPAPRMDGRKR
jgi:hypothetical protein